MRAVYGCIGWFGGLSKNNFKQLFKQYDSYFGSDLNIFLVGTEIQMLLIIKTVDEDFHR